MLKVWKEVERLSALEPGRPALGDLTYRGLRDAVAAVYSSLPELEGKRVGLLAGNTPVWSIFDIALTLKGAVVVPIAGFFSVEQVEHITRDAALEVVVTDEGANTLSFGSFKDVKIIDAGAFLAEARDKYRVLEEINTEISYKDIPSGKVIKVIYTSGTTGAPKGVMVTHGAIEVVTSSLAERSSASSSDRHLSLLPLSTLLEAVGGVYVPLLKGASVIYPSGSIREAVADPERIAGIIKESRPTTTTLVPALLEAFVAIAGAVPGLMPGSFRFMACGGAPTASGLLERAEELGLPVFQGYGLSECVSVVAVNSPEDNRPGSVGRPLPHARVRLSTDGEIIVGGEGIMAGYAGLGEALSSPKEISTGDIGYMDEDGYLYVTGRKDNVILTSLGRNVSPEWVEKEVVMLPSVKQVMVVGGEGFSSLVALVVPGEEWLLEAAERCLPDVSSDDMLRDVEASERLAGEMLKEITRSTINENLPEYARIDRVALIKTPFTPEDGLTTADGSLKRKYIRERYAFVIEALHDNRTTEEVI